MSSKTRPFMVSCDCVHMGTATATVTAAAAAAAAAVVSVAAQRDEGVERVQRPCTPAVADAGSALDAATATATAEEAVDVSVEIQTSSGVSAEPEPEPEPQLGSTGSSAQAAQAQAGRSAQAAQATQERRTVRLMVKQNDDLRKDQIVLDSIELMCGILSQEMPDLQLPLVRYKVLPTAVDAGLVEGAGQNQAPAPAFVRAGFFHGPRQAQDRQKETDHLSRQARDKQKGN
jgi:hypothetical protein